MKGIIFDFNGTLFDDNLLQINAWIQTVEEFSGKTVDAEYLKKNIFGVPNVVSLKRERPGLPESVYEEWSSRKEAVYRDMVRNMEGGPHLIHGAEAFFDRLTEDGIPFTIASSSIWDNISFFIEIFGLDRWIRPENIVYDDGSYENKVLMFREAARRIGADQVLIFEDSLSGSRNAIESGAKVVLMESGDGTDNRRNEPGFIAHIKNYDDIYDILKAKGEL